MNSKLAIDKTAFAVTALTETGGEKSYWLSRTPYERLLAVETLRRLNYGHDRSSARLQRVLEVAQRPPR
jgi:hypothetical protein